MFEHWPHTHWVLLLFPWSRNCDPAVHINGNQPVLYISTCIIRISHGMYICKKLSTRWCYGSHTTIHGHEACPIPMEGDSFMHLQENLTALAKSSYTYLCVTHTGIPVDWAYTCPQTMLVHFMCACVCVCTHAYTYMHTLTHTCTHTHAHTHTHARTHTHTHTHTHKHSRNGWLAS